MAAKIFCVVSIEELAVMNFLWCVYRVKSFYPQCLTFSAAPVGTKGGKERRPFLIERVIFSVSKPWQFLTLCLKCKLYQLQEKAVFTQCLLSSFFSTEVNYPKIYNESCWSFHCLVCEKKEESSFLD